MKAYLQDLIDRIGDDSLREGLTLPEGTSYSSDLTVGWEARIEAKQLTDPKLIKPLKEMLEQEKKTVRKIHILHVLIPLADKNNDHSMSEYILNFVKQEKTRWVRDVALHALSDTNLEIHQEQEYIFELVKHKDWQIQSGALGLMKKLDTSYSSRIEDVCIQLIKVKIKKPYILEHICGVLSRHGTKKCIPSMKDIIKNNTKAYVIQRALIIISKVAGKEELDYFIEFFKTNRNADVKWTITNIVCEHGDKNVVDLVIKRAKSIVSKQRKTHTIYCKVKPELVIILEFVASVDNDKYKKLIEFIKNKKIDYLDETELRWFKENTEN